MNSTPCFVYAVSLMPTGSVKSAEISDMCSLPLPDAIESATSKSCVKCGFNLLCNSSLNERISFEVSISSVFSLGLENGFSVALSLRRIISSQSMRLMSAEICP